MQRTVVSGLRTRPLVLMIGCGAVIGAYILHLDFNGIGLRETIFYHVLGYLIYLVFYGALALGLAQYVLMLIRRDDYLAVGRDGVAIGKKEIPFSDIQRISLGRRSLVEELIFYRRSASNVVIKTWMLSRPGSEVFADLQKAMSKHLGQSADQAVTE